MRTGLTMTFRLGGLGLAAALGLLAAGAPAAEPDAPAASGAVATPAAPASGQATTAEPAPEKPQAAPPAPKAGKPETPAERPPRRRLTEAEIRELPILKRYELPLEKGEAMLTDVKDNTFDYDEPAFYWLVSLIDQLPPALLKPGPQDEDLPFEQLLATPSSFRGQPVTIRGVYMQVSPWWVPVAALAKDVPHLYTCTIREEPMDRAMPVATVVVIDDPMAYLKVDDQVRVKGYFYKVRQYKGSKGVGFAPMIIARRIELAGAAGGGLLRSPLTTPGALFGNPVILVMLALILVMAVAFFVLRARTRAKSHATSASPYLRHRIRLQRGDREGPPGPGGPGGQPRGPEP